MDSAVIGLASSGFVLFVALVALIIWLSKSREKQVKAELQRDALIKGAEVRNAADKIMAEPVADEAAWLVAVAKRLREERDKRSS